METEMISNKEANDKMDKAVAVLEEEFPDCLFVMVALTDDQSATRYVSNMLRQDAVELITEVVSSESFNDGSEGCHIPN